MMPAAATGVAAPWVGLAAGLAALAAAHLAQHYGVVPCALCYVERWPYRVAIAVALAGLAWPRGRAGCGWLLVAVLLAAAALGALHAGVEWGWWKSPLPECAAPPLHFGTTRDLLASLPARPTKSCDEPTYLIPGLKLSMAVMNALFALAAAAAVAICLTWTPSRLRPA